MEFPNSFRTFCCRRKYENCAPNRFEDGETDGIRIPDNSVRKTPRFRSINANGSDPIERRKSRRHSTGTTPNSANGQQKCYSPRSPALDEDSSSSTNSGELNDVFGVHKGGGGGVHESAGVTPGLRRRRERAERQKSFLREQQEAAASGILRPFDIKDELINNHGMLIQLIFVPNSVLLFSLIKIANEFAFGCCVCTPFHIFLNFIIFFRF